VKNELQHLSLNKGMQRQAKLWSQAGQKMLRELALKPWASCRRDDLLGLLAMLDQQVGQLDQAVQQAAEQHAQAKLLMTQPGVGPNTALAFVLTLGEVQRFQRGKQVASYLGLIPREESSGGRQKLGAISKQGNRLVRMLLVEAGRFAPDRHIRTCRSGYRLDSTDRQSPAVATFRSRSMLARPYPS
jgi:transposase